MKCSETMESQAVPGHTHTCSGQHDYMDGSHWCAVCERWWWQRPVQKPKTTRASSARKAASARSSPTSGKRGLADLTCPVHGVEGTDPGDGFWEVRSDV